ncbi:MAG: nitrate reductase cytochrome c-type subunit [Alphaproteobacteria bacterium]|nr:nitrate reductase cytochrome c-type subunit [Alphaproteobacteria bacterium]
MTRRLWIAVALVAGLAFGGGLSAQQAPLKSDRGDQRIDEINLPPEVLRQEVPAGGFGRAYRQAPPLIPHRIDGYQITKDNNQCMSCHDWPQNARVGAPKVSETHYRDRDGNPIDRVAGTRWFCTSCHVPQLNARELVKNRFEDATQIR